MIGLRTFLNSFVSDLCSLLLRRWHSSPYIATCIFIHPFLLTFHLLEKQSPLCMNFNQMNQLSLFYWKMRWSHQSFLILEYSLYAGILWRSSMAWTKFWKFPDESFQFSEWNIPYLSNLREEDEELLRVFIWMPYLTIVLPFQIIIPWIQEWCIH